MHAPSDLHHANNFIRLPDTAAGLECS